MWEYTEEQQAELFRMAKIDTQITLFILLGVLIAILIFCFITDIFKKHHQNEYIKTLHDHEKAIITDYNHISAFRRRKERKQ